MNQLLQTLSFRSIRVFVSSTFMDMTEERNYLAQRIFPRVTEYCEQRNINFIPVDLRWGITKEESEDNNVVGICIDEIESSKPFFIGLAGWRYGWIPSEEDFGNRFDELCNKIPWLSDAVKRGTSITEIEFLYGAINFYPSNDKESVNAAFFLKDDPDEKCEPRQHNLRTRIEKQKCYPVNYYSSVEELGEKVYEELVHFIEGIFPPKEDGLISDRIRHTFMMQERAKNYIDAPGINPSEILSEWLLSGKTFLRVYGDTYIKDNKIIGWSRGKSMLLCRLGYELYNSGKYEVIYYDMEIFNTRKSAPLDQLVEYMENVIDLPVEKTRIFVIDNIVVFSDNTDVILSLIQRLAQYGLVMFTGMNGNWAFRLDPDLTYITKGAELDSEGRYKLITKYITAHGKKLLPEQIKKLARGHRDIYDLIALLPTLVRFGSFDDLDKEIDRFATWTPIDILIGNLKSNVGFVEPMWVLTAIALSGEGGLTEEEILGMTNMTMLRWAQIRRRVTEICRRRGNLYILEHHQRDHQSLIDNYYTNYRDYVIERMKNWIAENGLPPWRLSIVITKIYNSFIGSAEEMCDEFKTEKPSVYTDVEIVNNLRGCQIMDFWRLHQNENLLLEQPWVLRKTPKTYTRQDLIKYYQKLITFAGQVVNETWCRKFHNRLIELKGINPDDSILFEIRMAVEKRRDISNAVSIFNDACFISAQKRIEAIVKIMKAAFYSLRGELYYFFELFDVEKNILANDDFTRCKGELLELELEILNIRCNIQPLQEQKNRIESGNIINRLDFFLKRFHSEGWESPENALLMSLSGYVNTILGNYVYAQRFCFDTAVQCAIQIHSRASIGYKKAIFEYGMGFMNVDLPDLAISHINDSGILKEKAEHIINPWICLGLSDIVEDHRYPDSIRRAAGKKLEEINMILG